MGEREWEMGREEEGRERKRGRWMEGGGGGREGKGAGVLACY